MTIDDLQVLWIDCERRERHPIGSLRRRLDRYLFSYGDLAAAREHGFELLPEFADPHVEYSSTKLFATFAERVPSVRRADRVGLLATLGLDESADDFEILARSGGTLATDRIELAEQRPTDDRLERPLIFQVRGTQYNHPSADRPLRVGEELWIRRSPENPFDTNACELIRADGSKIGFIPKAHSAVVAAALAEGATFEIKLIRTVILPRHPAPTGSEPTWIAELRRRPA
ncbi:MAG: HIRAN domain-containing protein [Sandaracinus sp.]